MIFGRFNYNTTQRVVHVKFSQTNARKGNILRYQHSHDSQLSVGGKERDNVREK